MTTSKRRVTRHYAGQVLTWDFQADVFGGQYQLVSRDGPNRWTAVRLPPSEAEIAAIKDDPYYREHGGADEAIAQRFADAGRPFPIQFVSAKRYADYF